MNEYEKQIKRMEYIRKRNEQIKAENEKKLKGVLEQIENKEYRQYWERLNRAEVRRFWVWSFKLKKEIEEQGSNAPVHRAIWIGFDRNTRDETFLFNWEHGYQEAMKERKLWMPDGEVKTYNVDDLEVMDRQYITVITLGR